MAVRALAAGLLVTALAAGCGGADTAGPNDAPEPLLLALGDSLAVGVQPGPDGSVHETADAYPALLARRPAAGSEPMTLVQLGCGGATTTSLLEGGEPCRPARTTPYGTGSAVAHAEQLLSSRGTDVALVTLDIGANDLLACVTGPTSADTACVEQATGRATENVDRIGARLAAAAADGVDLVFVPMYNPFLAAWLLGADGRSFARASVPVVAEFNARLGGALAAHGFRVADAAAIAGPRGLDGPRRSVIGRRVPEPVARICDLTWLCVPPPRGPDVHPNADGQEVLAAAVRRALSAP